MSGLDFGKFSFSSSYTGSKALAADNAAEVDLDSSSSASAPSNPKTKAIKRKREEAEIAQ